MEKSLLADYRGMLQSYGITDIDEDGNCDKAQLLEALGLTKEIEEWDYDYDYKIRKTVPDEDQISHLISFHKYNVFPSQVTEEEAIDILKEQRDKGNWTAAEICDDLGI